MKKNSEKVIVPRMWLMNDARRQRLMWGFIATGVILILAVGIWYLFYYVTPYVEITASGESVTHGSNSDIGPVLFGLGVGLIVAASIRLLSYRKIRADPRLAKEVEIAGTDERNLSLMNKAKAKAFEIGIVLLSVFTVIYLITDVTTNSEVLQQNVPIVMICIMLVMLFGYSLLYRKYVREL